MADEKTTSLKDILRDLGENTSIHGIPKIISSKSKILKVFWIFTFLGTFGYLCYQLYLLMEDYYSFPVVTTVSLNFSALQFPSVTFCNMNPIRLSRLKETPADLQDVLKPANQTNESTGDGDTGNEGDYYDYTYSEEPDTDYMNKVDDYFENPSPIQEEFLKFENPSGYQDPWTERISMFRQQYKTLGAKQKKDIGHQLNDMLVSCTFNSRKCNISNFSYFPSLDYGNCYTLMSADFVSRKPGASFGLQMILNMEVSEYITSLSSAYGIKLLIHKILSVPYPSVEGVIISPQQETTIALRTVYVSRLGGDYGECESGETYIAKGKAYTQTSCLNDCRETLIMDKCNCLPSSASGFPLMNTRNLTSCQSDEIEFKKVICEFDVETDILGGTIKCNCPSPCVDTVYAKTISSRKWPHQKYMRQFLMAKVCAKEMPSTKNACEEYRKNPRNFNVESVEDNFLAINIYFEDVSYEVIKESPKYDTFQLLSSVGGILGLFVGASVLSFVEILHILLVISFYLCKAKSKTAKNTVRAFQNSPMKHDTEKP